LWCVPQVYNYTNYFSAINGCTPIPYPPLGHNGERIYPIKIVMHNFSLAAKQVHYSG